MSKILELKEASFAYGKNLILENINLELDQGEFVIILGQNGSGKTSLLKGLAGLIQPISGWVNWFTDEEIAYTSQQRSMNKDFPASVEEVVGSGRVLKKGGTIGFSPDDRKLIKEVMEELDIEKLRSRPFTSLSGGEEQKVLLARSLVAEARILLLDEPTTGLYPEARKDLLDLLNKLNGQGFTIIMVSHDNLGELEGPYRFIEVADKGLRELGYD